MTKESEDSSTDTYNCPDCGAELEGITEYDPALVTGWCPEDEAVKSVPKNPDDIQSSEGDEETHDRWLRGFGAFKDSDLPEKMKQERERMREEYSNDD